MIRLISTISVDNLRKEGNGYASRQEIEHDKMIKRKRVRSNMQINKLIEFFVNILQWVKGVAVIAYDEHLSQVSYKANRVTATTFLKLIAIIE